MTGKPVGDGAAGACGAAERGDPGPVHGDRVDGVAALKTGRSFIGVEKDRHHLEVAVDRLLLDLGATFGLA